MTAMDDLRLNLKPDLSFLGQFFEHVATVLAAIILADLFSPFITWAVAVQWPLDHYEAARAYVFGWLPFSISAQWQNGILLLAILVSMGNIGRRRRRAQAFFHRVFSSDPNEAGAEATPEDPEDNVLVRAATLCVYGVIGYVSYTYARDFLPQELPDGFDRSRWLILVEYVLSWSILGQMALLLVVVGGGLLTVATLKFSFKYLLSVVYGVLLAWRWTFVTAAFFLTVVAVNEIYVRWLASWIEDSHLPCTLTAACGCLTC